MTCTGDLSEHLQTGQSSLVRESSLEDLSSSFPDCFSDSVLINLHPKPTEMIH